MTQQIEWKMGLVGIALASLIVGLWPAATAEAVSVDGRVTPSDGYTVTQNMTYTVEKTPGVYTGATLYLHQDGGSNDVFVALTLPKTLVDNSYGTTAIGWGPSAPSGKNHKFQELAGSDKAQFVFRDGGGGVLFNVTMDYLHGLGDKKENPPYVADRTAGDFKIDFGAAIDVLAGSSGMVYNWDTFGASNPECFDKDSDSPGAGPDYTNSLLPGWVYEVTYEFQVAGSVFGGPVNLNQLDFVTIPVVHASPNKIGGNKLEDFTPTGPPVIPEPLTMLGALMGVTGLAGYLRRRGSGVTS